MGVELGVRDLIDRLQAIDRNLPLRVVPLRIQVFAPVEQRVARHSERDRRLAVQEEAISAWTAELERPFRSYAAHSTDLRHPAKRSNRMTTATRQVESAEFSQYVDQEVLSVVSAGPNGFVDILMQLPSVYPTDLLASIDRLAVGGLISAQLAEAIRCEAARPNVRPRGGSLLPPPHPLDFEWRYTPDSSRDLLTLATDLTPPDGDVLLFGTPGLALEALLFPASQRMSFLAEDNVVTERLILLNRAAGSPLSIDLNSGPIPQASADAVLLDPPWYMDFIRPMLEDAVAACRVGGVVLISLPPRGTRPSADADHAATIRFAGRLGLELLDRRFVAVDYDTPFFETNALAAAGVHPSVRWRRGDLVVLRKLCNAVSTALPVNRDRRDWIEVSIGRLRLFIRTHNDDVTGSRGLIRLIDGDILPSVSRRDPRRRYAQVWTSGNRVFGTDNPALVIEAALSYTDLRTRSGVHPSVWCNLYEREVLERVGEELLTLAEIEAAEERGSPTRCNAERGYGHRIRPNLAPR